MKAISKLMGKSTESEEKVESHYSTTDSMKAVVWEKGKMSVKNVPRPLLLRDEDVIVRVTMCGVSSGEDKKLTSGEAPSVETLSEGAQMSGPQNIIVGHECVGIVADKGPAVKNLSIGQRVAVAYDYACGQCPECENGHHSCCELMNAMEREAEAAGKEFHPSTNLGGHCKLPGYTDGSHAEYVRVPFGDVNCFPVPDKVSDEKALLLSGVLCTALHAVELGEVSENTTVAIWGLGPIGMCAARWCQIRGARRVVGIDTVSERLGLAFAKLGIDAVNRKDADKGSLAIKLHQMEPKGFDVCIDAIGYQPHPSTMEKVMHTLSMSSENLPRNPTDVLDECIESVKPYGRVVVIGDYGGQSHTFPIGKIMSKSVTLKSGRCPCQKYFRYITKSLQDGTIDPTFLITHRVTLDELPTVFDNITSKKDEGFVKIVATVGDDYSKTEPRESRHLATDSKHLGTETRQMGADTQHMGADTKHLGTEPRPMAAEPRHVE